MPVPNDFRLNGALGGLIASQEYGDEQKKQELANLLTQAQTGQITQATDEKQRLLPMLLQRAEQEKMRAQYVPLIMQQVAAQQAREEQARYRLEAQQQAQAAQAQAAQQAQAAAAGTPTGSLVCWLKVACASTRFSPDTMTRFSMR